MECQDCKTQHLLEIISNDITILDGNITPHTVKITITLKRSVHGNLLNNLFLVNPEFQLQYPSFFIPLGDSFQHLFCSLDVHPLFHLQAYRELQDWPHHIHGFLLWYHVNLLSCFSLLLNPQISKEGRMKILKLRCHRYFSSTCPLP